jgi:hypothetical protein
MGASNMPVERARVTVSLSLRKSATAPLTGSVGQANRLRHDAEGWGAVVMAPTMTVLTTGALRV